ncbi:MAG: tetratricopeptide repeat protein, partial [Deltaproteobacteria bacterium]|nr:tetratricopeptide repeat protein [Nannocystaceae bacterium]
LVETGDARVPAWLQTLLRRGLARQPADRFVSMRELVTELERDRRYRTRALLVAAGLLVAGGLGVVLARGMSDAQASCAAFDATLDGVWDRAQRERIAVVFAATDKPYAAASRREVERTLDAYAGELLAARTEACTDARIHGTQGEQMMGQRMACLDGRTRQLGALTEALAGGGVSIVEHAVDAARSLPAVSGCSDVDRLLREVALPDDPETRAEVVALRGELEAIDAAIRAAAFERLGARIDELLARARGTAHTPVVAEVLLRRGVLASALGEGDAAAVALEEALALAETRGHDEVVIAASTELVTVEGRLRSRYEVADLHARHAEAVLERAGNPTDARLRLLSQIGQLANLRHDYPRALATLGEASTLARNLGRDHDPATAMVRSAMTLALIGLHRLDEADQLIAETIDGLQRSVGASHPNTGAAVASRARLRSAQERPEEAAQLWQRARAVFVAAYGPDHANVGAAFNGEGLALVNLARDREAEQAFAQSLGVSERTLGRDHLHVAIGLCNLARTQTRLGRADEAVGHLRRAIEIRTARLGSDAAPTASAQDLLGDALFEAGDVVGAAAAYRRAISSFERLGGAEDTRAAYGWHGLGRIAERAGDLARAARDYGRAHTLLSRDTAPFDRGDVLFGLARVLAASAPDRASELR